MPQTPSGGATPYLTAARLWLYRDVRPVLELLTDDDTLPLQSEAENPATDPGKKLAAALAAASGEFEMYALLGGRYAAADLAAVVSAGGNGQAAVERLVADLAAWFLACRRWPRLKPDEFAGATQALEKLQMLRDGEVLFPATAEAAAAGLPAVTTIDPGDDRVTVRAAGRVFGVRNWNRGS